MTRLLEDAFNPESFRENGHQLVDLLADYLSTLKNTNNIPVIKWKSPEDMEAKWKTDFSEPRGTGLTLKEFCADVIENSIHVHHPGYMGHQVAVPAPMTALVEMMSALLNNSMAIYEMGPFSSAVEKIVIDWLGASLGMDKKSGGILTSGGSIGNLTALLAARQDKAGYNIWEEGQHGQRRSAVMVSSESHYSIARAVKIMGWGEEGIVKIPVNNRMEIDPTALETAYRHAIKEGKQVIAVVGNACSTSTGTYDPLDEIAGFCRKNNLWFHVDAAHGGGAIFSSKYKRLVKGIENADSIVIDFHKMLLCPGLTTAVVFKNSETAYETFSQKAFYLLNAEKRENWSDIAQRTLECTKKMMGIKIYALLKMYGVQLFDDYITRTYDTAKAFAEMIKETPGFELALEPASNIVCFRYAPSTADKKELDKINIETREKIKEAGEFYIVRTVIEDAVYLRVTLMNPFTSQNELKRLLQRIRG